MRIINYTVLIYFLIVFQIANANNREFNEWLILFKQKAIKNGISKNTVESVMNKANFLPKVIKYDRYQPEFYEDTKTYITKRSNKLRVKNATILYNNNKKLIDSVEQKFSVEKELLLSLMGIETNYGKHLGKMDIISSLATLAFDKRRSVFFSNELLTLLRLIDIKLVDQSVLYGSWAGAYGNFQFMPTTIKNYALDFDNNSTIQLKELNDSFASAANYINKIGWNRDQPCFFKVELKKNISKKYLNTSAKKLINKKKLIYFENYIKNFQKIEPYKDSLVAIITPDKDIIPNIGDYSPAYIVFKNYDLILKWNRSLRFALAVCTLKNKIKNEL